MTSNPGDAPVNPYAAPLSAVADQAETGAEADRSLHLKHEASIGSAGWLFVLGGAALMLVALAMMLTLGTTQSRIRDVVMVLLLGAIGALQLVTGLALRKLKIWSRGVATVYCVLGLLAIPVGTLINGFILYLFFCAKGKRVFAPDYQEVIAATPHLKYKTSLLVWIIGGLVLLLIGVALLWAVLGV